MFFCYSEQAFHYISFSACPSHKCFNEVLFLKILITLSMISLISFSLSSVKNTFVNIFPLLFPFFILFCIWIKKVFLFFFSFHFIFHYKKMKKISIFFPCFIWFFFFLYYICTYIIYLFYSIAILFASLNPFFPYQFRFYHFGNTFIFCIYSFQKTPPVAFFANPVFYLSVHFLSHPLMDMRLLQQMTTCWYFLIRNEFYMLFLFYGNFVTKF